ncbi:MAG: thioredoxin [Oscillospiraceae bacterium]|nr:thioredoxin [Oscillospiraceae bacterium]
MSSVKIKKSNFKSEVLNEKKPVLVDFFASWCGPCRILMPVIDEISDERNDIKVVKVDIDDCPKIAESYDVTCVPTLMLFKDSKPLSKIVGAFPKPGILKFIEEIAFRDC